MINEELKTFISKMRAAGKADSEITALLKQAGWEETIINRELLSLPSKRWLHFRKVKFWITLYGVTIALFILESIFGPTLKNWGPTSGFFDVISAILLSFLFAILPLFTLFSIVFEAFFWILKRIPRFKNWSLEGRINFRWAFVVCSFVGGAIMLLVGNSGARQPDLGMGLLIMVFIGILGLAWMILALILAVILVIAKII